MIEVGDVLISDDIKNEFFVCNIDKCKGECCVAEGGFGAPLEESELPILEEIYDKVKPYLPEEAILEIEKQGLHIYDEKEGYGTPTINNRACVYVFKDENNIAKCGIEQAHIDGKIDWKKPLSCHLYPIRAKKYDAFTALNYDRWDICSDACSFGAELKVPIYKFLQEPLERKFGIEWFAKLEKIIDSE